jgi:hypothetical protein
MRGTDNAVIPGERSETRDPGLAALVLGPQFPDLRAAQWARLSGMTAEDGFRVISRP